jgi:hypothetical protein
MEISNQKKFYDVYVQHLKQCSIEYPEQYKFSEDKAEEVAQRMIKAFMNSKAKKDGPAIKRTCKTLGIGYTYKAIEQYLGVR